MKYISKISSVIQDVVDSPRPQVLWQIILFVASACLFFEVLLGSYVFNTVRIGMESRRTAEVKNMDASLKKIYDPERVDAALDAMKARQTFFEKGFEKSEVDETEEIPEIQ